MLKHLLYVMRIEEKLIQRRITLALAHLCSPEDQRTIFIDNNGVHNPLLSPSFIYILAPNLKSTFNYKSYIFGYAGLDVLLGLLNSSNSKQQEDGFVALFKLANKAMTLSPMDAAPLSPTPQVCFFQPKPQLGRSVAMHLRSNAFLFSIFIF